MDWRHCLTDKNGTRVWPNTSTWMRAESRSESRSRSPSSLKFVWLIRSWRTDALLHGTYFTSKPQYKTKLYIQNLFNKRVKKYNTYRKAGERLPVGLLEFGFIKAMPVGSVPALLFFGSSLCSRGSEPAFVLFESSASCSRRTCGCGALHFGSSTSEWACRWTRSAADRVMTLEFFFGRSSSVSVAISCI